MLFSIYIVHRLYSCHLNWNVKRTKINKKRPRLALLKNTFFKLPTEPNYILLRVQGNQMFTTDLKTAWMVCLGFEPTVAEW